MEPSDRILKACAGRFIAHRLCWAYAHIDYIISVDYEKQTFITDVTGVLTTGETVEITAEFRYMLSKTGRYYIKSFEYMKRED